MQEPRARSRARARCTTSGSYPASTTPRGRCGRGGRPVGASRTSPSRRRASSGASLPVVGCARGARRQDGAAQRRDRGPRAGDRRGARRARRHARAQLAQGGGARRARRVAARRRPPDDRRRSRRGGRRRAPRRRGRRGRRAGRQRRRCPASGRLDELLARRSSGGRCGSTSRPRSGWRASCCRACRERGAGHLVFVSSLSGKAASPRALALLGDASSACAASRSACARTCAARASASRSCSPGFIRDAGMFADSGAKPPPGFGTAAPEEVAAGVVRGDRAQPRARSRSRRGCSGSLARFAMRRPELAAQARRRRREQDRRRASRAARPTSASRDV